MRRLTTRPSVNNTTFWVAYDSPAACRLPHLTKSRLSSKRKIRSRSDSSAPLFFIHSQREERDRSSHTFRHTKTLATFPTQCITTIDTYCENTYSTNVTSSQQGGWDAYLHRNCDRVSMMRSTEQIGKETVHSWIFTVFMIALTVTIRQYFWIFLIGAVIYGLRASYLSYTWSKARKEDLSS